LCDAAPGDPLLKPEYRKVERNFLRGRLLHLVPYAVQAGEEPGFNPEN